MSVLLQQLCLAPDAGKAILSGLVSVKNESLPPQSIAEHVVRREALLLRDSLKESSIGIDYIFFRRFSDGRSPQVAAYVVDNSRIDWSREDIAELHRRVWLGGTAPLLYVEWPTQVDVLRCATGPEFWDSRKGAVVYQAGESIKVASAVSQALDDRKVRRFGAFRLSSGTFWEDPGNADWACASKSAHKLLLQAAIDADGALKKSTSPEFHPLMRRLLLLFIFTKYLEDRGVFPDGWFEDFVQGAGSFIDVLGNGQEEPVRAMLAKLQDKFNGDIFELPELECALQPEVLSEFVNLLRAKTLKRQRYLWEQYSFRYIPVEILSHLYQHFAQHGTGAIYTPPFVADLILDQVMPYEKLTGRETVLDPTCGSGVFLVGAFRRLVHHWQSLNEWERPNVSLLKRILRKSIFGAEDLSEAAHVAALNLALAVCEALQPKVIWEELRFDKLIGHNLFTGDFFSRLDELRQAVPAGFSCIVGNPPFASELTPAALETRREELKKISIPDGNIAYRVTEQCVEMLADDGLLCLLQPSGLLYNAKTRNFVANFLRTHTVEMVLDFVSIRNLFESADTKAIALVVRCHAPEETHVIRHFTFRRTKSVHERLGFELDHYDLHDISQTTAENQPWIWKANLLGGGRLEALGRQAQMFESFKAYFSRLGWEYGEGFIEAKSGNRTSEPWLTGKPYLPTRGLQSEGIVGEIATVEAKEFRSAYTPKRYTGPIIMIRANERIPMIFRSRGFLAYRDKIIGISTEEADEDRLLSFFHSLREHEDTFRFLIYLFSTQMLVGKSTAFLKRDLDAMPSPGSGFFEKLSWWEKVLIQDVLGHFVEMVRAGQRSRLTLDSVSGADFETYANIFVRLLGSVYTNLEAGRSGFAAGMAYQAFSFGEESDLAWPNDWSISLGKLLFKQDSAALRTQRILRFYEGNTLIIVKPDRLRNWIPSTAIRDADETMVDLQQQGF